MKYQLDDRWGRPSGVWSENGELVTTGYDVETVKAELKASIDKMNAGPQPYTLKRRAWEEAQQAKRRR